MGVCLLALVRSLVNEAGVAQEDIIVCEPSRAITDSIYNKIHREFPDVVFIDNIGGEGRLKCEYLREAATIPNPVTGVVYDPERDGKPLAAPLGLMEHADKDRHYTKLDMIYVKQ